MKALKLKTLVASMALVAVAAAPELARADNVAFSTNNIAITSALAAAATDTCDGSGGFSKILTAQIANSGAPKDFVLGLSAETSIVTVTQVASKNGEKSTAWAEGKIEMCVEAVSDDGTTMAEPGVITFDRRKQELWAKLTGLDCNANLATGVVTCNDPEQIGLLLDTTAAHHFNFVAQNSGPGPVTINAYARVTCSNQVAGSDPVINCANRVDPNLVVAAAGVTAVIGNASLVAFEVQAANHQ